MTKKKFKAGHKNPVKSINPLPEKQSANSLQKDEPPKKLYTYIITILAITFISFSNSLNNKFVNWDDDQNIYTNDLVTSINKQNFWDHTARIFKTPTMGNYNPLSIWTLAIDKMIYGIDYPEGFHMTNLILHLSCTALVFYIVLGLRLHPMVAFITALLFGIHPMRVESVAWATERKDVLFGFFYLFALLLYIRHQSGLSKKSHGIPILFLFVLSLFSKIQAVILPLSMLTVDYYLSGNITWKQIFAKSHFFIFSLIFGIVGLLFLKDQGSLDASSTANLEWYHKPFVGMFTLVVYLIKSIIPFRLSPLYPYPGEALWYYYICILIVPILGFLIYRSYKSDNRVVAFGLSFFIVNVFMLLQILSAGQGYLADRFTYIPYLGLFLIFGFYINQWLSSPRRSYVKWGLVLLITIYAGMTYNQNRIWYDSETLWTHVLKYYDRATTPYGNRANFRRDNKNILGAMADYSAVIHLKPNAQVYNSRAKLYFDNFDHPDSLRKALIDYTKAIEMDPDDAEFYANRGGTYARLNDFENALKDCNTAIELNPKFANAYLNRSVIYHQANELKLALQDIMSYLKLKPMNADLWYEACRINILLDNYPEGEKMIEKAIALNSKSGIFYYQRALLYYNTQRFDLAKNDILKAISLGYNDIDPVVKINLGI